MTTNLNRTDKQRASLDQMNNLAWLLDNSIRIPIINYRIGLDAIIGLIPGLGDMAGLLFSSVIVIQAIRLGAPGGTLLQMVLNIAIEALIGLVPMLGDVFDATFKSNIRNMRLLNLALDYPQTGRAVNRAAGTGIIVAVIVALMGIIVLIGVAGVAVFWAIISLLQSTQS
jgi:hypothetical protein